MTVTIDLTEADLMTALRGFLLPIVNCPVVPAEDNQPLPSGTFVTMTSLSIEALASNKSRFADTGSATTSRLDYLCSSQWTVQLDFYGVPANSLAMRVAGLVGSDYAADWFAAGTLAMTPLYASQLRNTTRINSEQQYQPRWTFNFVAQFNPVITTAMDYADQLHIEVAEVAIKFPPED
ncbi:hypothetical protein [Pseudomonas sp. GV071]|uniref:phage neck terminator protein n=1 Tax=Pseudomonas sp. GV071 TaxID=2135754 RepID=UPI000D36AE21|nr:hypothetical protein [Pseudomonas sp. GV071]PTQ70295.1 hypothetical protein C8K61_10617 [Pseudomonas sp. GV071]